MTAMIALPTLSRSKKAATLLRRVIVSILLSELKAVFKSGRYQDSVPKSHSRAARAAETGTKVSIGPE
jgi:hypothetical protein